VKEEVKISETLLWNSLFNPARYLKLFEIIPGPQTSSEVLNFLTIYGEKGKDFGCCKDTQRLLETVLGFTESKFVPLG
jgi:3-hydroxyacyl-CoA dehydrogenase